jgi:hypothetical protein
MSVTQTSTTGTLYTWGGSTWSWDDLRGAKTWDTSAGSSFSCTEAISTPIAEARRSAITDVYLGTLATAEARRSGVAERSSSAVALAEARADVWSAARTFAGTLATAEARRSAIAVVDSSALATAEARADVWSASRTWSSSISLAETYSDLIAWIQANLEAFSTSTLASEAVTKRALAEAFSTAEARRSSIVDVYLGTLALDEARRSDVTERQSEALATAEARADVWTIVRTPAETLALFEARRSAVTNVETETLATAEARSDVVAFARSFASSFATAEDRADVWTAVRNAPETLATAEARRSVVGSNDSETLATAEARADVFVATRTFPETLATSIVYAKGFTAGNPETLAVAESRADVWTALRSFSSSISWTESYIDNIAWIQANAETLGLSAVYAKAIGNVNPESFATVDRLFKAITDRTSESVAFSETYTDLIAWIQANLESFAVAEAAPTAIAKRILRDLRVRDMALRNATGVYGDLSVSSTALTPASFADIVANRTPTGFDEFKQYLPGDYQFQRALIDIALEPFDLTGATLSLQSARTTVDVPDLNDRGSVAVPTAGVAVEFNRTFNTVPEISIQQTGGAGPALPMVSSLTTTGFFVRLYDAANPTTAVSGSVSWSVIGN